MVKVYDLLTRAKAEAGETVLGTTDLETEACYLLYGILDPGAKGRVLNPGPGHEEIICIVAGLATLIGPDGPQDLRIGEAFYLKGDVVYTLENHQKAPVVYIAAGGHTPGEHHHH
ncbi:hypothetical protein [Desulfobacca acetoxidans]|uniref:Cupin domain-containing protein n=1 Tax=Desulfobacca acetoxidans (strain ATCC 700848 / DSM 11109 / ASRB2) TaxID=880072 RepID=F2NIK8_DESAR|nr:hypothetical protein [Desulfobacca acetoxidans]AEB10483.1 hypothetical protein Desac_2668 [Desulfobacca acetoxidans DSM 11109]